MDYEGGGRGGGEIHVALFVSSTTIFLVGKQKFLTIKNQEAVLEDKTTGKWVKRTTLMESSHPFYLNCISTDITISLSFNDHLKNYLARVSTVAVGGAMIFTVSNQISKTLSMLPCFKSCTNGVHPGHSLHSPPTPHSLCLRIPLIWQRLHLKDKNIVFSIKITSQYSTTCLSGFQIWYCYSPPQESTREWHFLAV